jgi:ATP-dependent 26S proteasome regulatory subunit
MTHKNEEDGQKNDEEKHDEEKHDEQKNDEQKNDEQKNDESKNDDSKNDDSKNDEQKNDEEIVPPIETVTSFIFYIKGEEEEEEHHKCDDCPEDINIDDNKKRKRDNVDSIFKQIIDNFNKKNVKKQKLSHIDEFKKYFTESDILLPINKNIKTLKDLIELGKTYDPSDKNRYVINLKALHKSIKPLEDLDAMIGMKNVKETIIDLIFFRLQNIQDNHDIKDDLWHLVIQGTPGSGKTEVARIIGKLYYSLGIVKKDKFTLVRRSDLIGKYLGHTAKMTQEVFDNAKGGILFIDEAYSLGSSEQRDSFSKECIDTINQNLTENRETIVFIAGYKDSLNESFFAGNQGLSRRFKFRFNIDKYSGSELRRIFIKKINENNWTILNNNFDKEIPINFFEKNIKSFKFNGGSMENLWHLTKIYHSRRIFGKSNDYVKKIVFEDIENGFKAYCENNDEIVEDIIPQYLLDTMYC